MSAARVIPPAVVERGLAAFVGVLRRRNPGAAVVVVRAKEIAVSPATLGVADRTDEPVLVREEGTA